MFLLSRAMAGASTKLEIKHRSARSAVTGMYLGPVQVLPGRTAVTGMYLVPVQVLPGRTAVTGMYLGPVQILPGRTAPGSEGVGVVYDRRLLPAADCQERCVPGQS